MNSWPMAFFCFFFGGKKLHDLCQVHAIDETDDRWQSMLIDINRYQLIDWYWKLMGNQWGESLSIVIDFQYFSIYWLSSISIDWHTFPSIDINSHRIFLFVIIDCSLIGNINLLILIDIGWRWLKSLIDYGHLHTPDSMNGCWTFHKGPERGKFRQATRPWNSDTTATIWRQATTRCWEFPTVKLIRDEQTANSVFSPVSTAKLTLRAKKRSRR